ncbi:uncharacterized protein JCM6883_007537 [Sporobolomyces salmoneus]|uniref:uncharacterized protein n=1 Tax=Sporobolomyces salmoneus TaxID=183962 RepID=UPI0031816584
MATRHDRITLTTCDDPPAYLTVSRSALVVQSKVFGDMLSMDLQHENNDHSIPLDDRKADLKMFVTLLEGKETQESLNALKVTEWEAIARLADKYDCGIVRKSKRKKGSAAFAFTLAAWTGSHKSIETTAKRAILVEDLKSPGFRAPQEWMEKLAAWRTCQKAAYFDHASLQFFQDVMLRCSNHPFSPENGNAERHRFGQIAVSRFNNRFSGSIFVEQDFANSTFCLCRRREMREKVDKFESLVKLSNKFPMDINLGSLL